MSRGDEGNVRRIDKELKKKTVDATRLSIS